MTLLLNEDESEDVQEKVLTLVSLLVHVSVTFSPAWKTAGEGREGLDDIETVPVAKMRKNLNYENYCYF